MEDSEELHRQRLDLIVSIVLKNNLQLIQAASFGLLEVFYRIAEDANVAKKANISDEIIDAIKYLSENGPHEKLNNKFQTCVFFLF